MSFQVEEPLRQFPVREHWAERSFFRSTRDGDYSLGFFTGRGYELEQLISFFIDSGGGTALVSGHRGVGKTATVDQALIRSKEKIEDENRKAAKARPELLRTGAEDVVRETRVERLRPKELVALKLDFGHIAVARAAASTPNGRASGEEKQNSRTSEIDPRQVLVEIIKGVQEQFAGRAPTPIEQDEIEQCADLDARKSALTLYPKPFYILTLPRIWPMINASPSLRPTFRIPRVAWLRRQWHRIRRRKMLEQRQRTFWTQLSDRASESLQRASNQTYREEYARASSTETVRQRSRAMSLDFKKALPVLASALSVAGPITYFTGWLPELFSGFRVIAALVVSLVGVAANVKFASNTTSKSSDGVRLVYSRDGSVPSLKRDLEEILGLLESSDAPKDFRIVVVLDELDKIEDDTMLDRVIQSFKNLFTLNRAVFVFITDKQYFVHIDDMQHRALKEQTYAQQHTFFTLKLFLPRPDYADIKDFMDAIKDTERSSSSADEQSRWEETVRYLTFESRSHFFDLMALLTELIGVDNDKRPVLRLMAQRVGGETDLRRKARFERMIEMIYVRERYRSHNDYQLNNDLLGALYSTFDNLQYSSFKMAEYRALSNANEDDARRRAAQQHLLGLLKTCEAVDESRVAGNGHLRYTWKQRLCSEPDSRMLPLENRQRAVLQELSDASRKWRKIIEALS